ncbi:MAG: T9SS type A sorting domain-containing protein [Bacteroidales bacterium]|jgi:hypothetical protein|nr:T9SS type A sorting domain-containing protein [Bacteroidales bacterium]
MIKIFVFIFSLFILFSADIVLAQNDGIVNVKVRQSEKKTDILIFPNPTSGFVTVRIPYEAKNVSMQLFAQNGHCVLNKNLYAPADNLLDVRRLEAGVYMYQIFENYRKIDAGKLIISR